MEHVRRLVSSEFLTGLLGHPVWQFETLGVDAERGVWVSASTAHGQGKPDTPQLLLRVPLDGADPEVVFRGRAGDLDRSVLHEVARRCVSQSSALGVLPVHSRERPSVRMWTEPTTTWEARDTDATLWGEDDSEREALLEGGSGAQVLCVAPWGTSFVHGFASKETPRAMRYGLATKTSEWTLRPLVVEGQLSSPLWIAERLLAVAVGQDRRRAVHAFDPRREGPLSSTVIIPDLGLHKLMADAKGERVVIAHHATSTSGETAVFSGFPMQRQSRLKWNFHVQTLAVRGDSLVSERQQGREAKSLWIHHYASPIGREICTGPCRIDIENQRLRLCEDRPWLIRRTGRSGDGLCSDLHAVWSPLDADAVDPIRLCKLDGEGFHDPIPL